VIVGSHHFDPEPHLSDADPRPLTPLYSQWKLPSTDAVWRIWDIYPGSRILIFTHPGSRISDLGSKSSSKREGWKKIICHTFFGSHKFHIIENVFIFKMLMKKIWANFQRIIELFTKKIVTKLSKIWVWDPGSGKNPFRIPDPGSRGKNAPDPRSGSATLSLSDEIIPAELAVLPCLERYLTWSILKYSETELTVRKAKL
jgi:hypothetical protein